MRYRVSAIGRRVGAIGVTGHFLAVVEAHSEEEARLKLYDEWEHIDCVKIRRLDEPKEEV